MFNQCKSRHSTGLNLIGKPCCSLRPVAKLPPKLSDEDWELNNKLKFRITDDQERLADQILEESRRMIDETNDTTKGWKHEVDHHLRERASEIRFLVEELRKQKKTALLEEECLSTYRKRVLNGLDFLKAKSLAICQQCLIWRECRIGPDLVCDEVDRNINMEVKLILNSQKLMEKVLSETNEQLRKLRAAMYLLDKDLSHKDRSLQIDEKNLKMRESQMSNRQDDGPMVPPPCHYSLCEWQHRTYNNIDNNAKMLEIAGQLRAYVDLMLKKVIEDMQFQTDKTNDAFQRRIAEVKHVKKILEGKHNDCTDHINALNRNIRELERELSNKKDFLELCLSRQNNRAQRPGIEQTCDTVQNALYNEEKALKSSICKLNRKLAENRASLRYLLHVQLMQEEEINIKSNSIKIDEVDCMTLRQALCYQSF